MRATQYPPRASYCAHMQLEGYWVARSSRAMTRGPSRRGGGRRFERGKTLALGREARQQRRRLERLVAGALRIGGEPVADPGEPDLVGVGHRAAAPHRPAVAVDPDHVDVARPTGDALLEDARALVDHRVDHALDDLLLVDRSSRDAEPA